jgi:hypothetical protein
VCVQRLDDIKCQLDSDGELNVPVTSQYRAFMRGVFGVPMTKSIVKCVLVCSFGRPFVCMSCRASCRVVRSSLSCVAIMAAEGHWFSVVFETAC